MIWLIMEKNWIILNDIANNGEELNYFNDMANNGEELNYFKWYSK